MHASPLLLALLLACALPACRGSADKAPEHAHHHEKNLPPVGSSVSVLLDGKSATVELASIPRAAGSNAVPLPAVVRTAWPAEDPSHLRLDPVGSDGFRPTARPKCGRPLDAGEVARAWMDVTSHDVSFDAGLQLPGCFHVKAVTTVEARR